MAAVASIENTQFDTANVGITDIRTLIILLSSPEQSVCVNAIEILTKYAETASKHRLQLLSLGIIKPLLSLISSKDPSIRKSATACLAATTEIPGEVHNEMRSKELIVATLKLLSPAEELEVQEEAAFVVSNLAKDFANKSEIRKQGGVKALVKLLESTDPDVKKNVSLALSTLLDDFGNKSEIRYVNGITPLLELLSSEHVEIQENVLQSLIKCTEDFNNRIEIRKVNGVKRLIDLLIQEPPELHNLTLMCIANCLEDPETNRILHDIGGLLPLLKFLQLDDVKVKRNALLALFRAAKNDRNQIYLREGGALPLLLTNLSHSDAGVISYSAMALSNLARNVINQLELMKLGIIETLLKNLSHEDVEVLRQSTLALSNLFLNPKLRLKFKQCDGVPSLIKLLSHSDQIIIRNVVECIANLAEDSILRIEISKLNGVPFLSTTLDSEEEEIICAGCLALSRCLQEEETKDAFTNVENYKKILKLLCNKSASVNKHAALVLSNTIRNESDAKMASQIGILESLISLSRDTASGATKFATNALEILLNYQLSAKYWLKGYLSPQNLITDLFYDTGPTKKFHAIEKLTSEPISKSRETILIKPATDQNLQSLIQSITTPPYPLPQLPTHSEKYAFIKSQLSSIAIMVSTHFGGTTTLTNLDSIGYAFKITRLKMKQGSNIIPIGLISVGTFYHRALLFKFLCDCWRRNGESFEKSGLDRVFLGSSLERGEYSRAWNTVVIRNGDKVEEYLVDLMFEPGKFMTTASVEAETYKHLVP